MHTNLFFLFLFLCFSFSVLIPHSEAASQLNIFPYPQNVKIGATNVSVDATNFQIITASKSAILQAGIRRYLPLIFPFHEDKRMRSEDALNSLMIIVNSDDETLKLGVDENYTLSIDQQSISLQAPTIYGALHGLETFSQLVNWIEPLSSYQILNVPISIQDAPRFAWRGLMIDTSRHYLSKSTILRTIDAISYNKMNTLHWHIVDAQSFPIQIRAYPLLSQKGAYSPHAVYTPQDVADIVQYAKERGVRVVPEFDVPGHSASWGKGYNIVANCPSYSANVNNIPLDPSKDDTFTVLQGIFSEVAKAFFDQYFHTGGDEVVFGCWSNDGNISKWMIAQKFTTRTQVEQYFENKLQPIISGLGKTMVVWEDLFDDNVTLASSTVIEVWKDASTLQRAINRGYNALLAAPYYLDKQSPIGVNHYSWVDTWQDFYNSDPYNNINANYDKILGGEACMWGEAVDSINFDSRVWPRAAAVAERLWSSRSLTDISDASHRLVGFRCLLAQRGIGAGPITPDYCPLPLQNV